MHLAHGRGGALRRFFGSIMMPHGALQRVLVKCLCQAATLQAQGRHALSIADELRAV